MVTDAPEAPEGEADQEQEEVQTEAPQVELEEAGAESSEAAAASDDRIARMEAELAELRASRERDIAEERERVKREEADRIQREYQSRQAAEANRRERETQRKQRASREAKLALHEAGYVDAPVEALEPAFESYVNESRDIIRQGSLNDAMDAWSVAAAKYFDVPLATGVNPSEDAYNLASNYGGFIETMASEIARRHEESLVKSGWLSPEKVQEAIEGDRKARKEPPGDNLKRPERGTAPSVMTWDAYISLPEAERLAMPSEERQKIMAADRKARLGG